MLLMPLLIANLLLAFVGAVAPTTPAAASKKHALAEDYPGAGVLSTPHPSYFPGSQILSAEQGSTLNGLAGFGATQNWTMCYSSFTNDSSTPDVYHEQCDQHTKTLHVVINHVAGVPRVFGAFAVRAPTHSVCSHPGALSLLGASFGCPHTMLCAQEGAWDKAACCAVSANTCGPDYCTDRTSAGNWLFRLGPGAPGKFGPNGANTAFQFVVPTEWPKWGDGGYDLYMGCYDALGATSSCWEGSTYAGAPNQVCGGNGNWDWGETNMEVWYMAKVIAA
eukprot:COSAG03_NODE_2296_length_2907_cov_2.655271_3_plen_278_part_00